MTRSVKLRLSRVSNRATPELSVNTVSSSRVIGNLGTSGRVLISTLPVGGAASAGHSPVTKITADDRAAVANTRTADVMVCLFLVPSAAAAAPP